MITKVKDIRIGTRGSKLALWQAHFIAGEIKKRHPEVSISLVPIQTTGDKMVDVPLAKIGGKGLFLKEIENALLDGKIDLAVHSMKDVPNTLPSGLVIPVMTEREDPRDVFVSSSQKTLMEIPAGACIGTSSLRRLCQLRSRRSDLNYVDLRGNVDTRLRKLKEGQFDAIVLAAAGMKRLGLQSDITEFLDLIPAVGQGAIGIEVRAEDKSLIKLLMELNHAETNRAVSVERAFLKVVEGSCQIPVGCHAKRIGSQWDLNGFVADPSGSPLIERHWPVKEEEAQSKATLMAEEILQNGGREILDRVLSGK